MTRRALCPQHNDTTPSMVIYGNWAHCMVCQAHILTSELNLPGSFTDYPRREPTDVKKQLERVNKLPLVKTRGLLLPTDSLGYYIVWPNGDFYKRRNFEDTKARYTGPAGIKPPLFVYPGKADHLVVVEGELNAMSLHQIVFGEYRVCSPGSATEMTRHIKYYLQFKRVSIFVDNDPPGIVYGLMLKDLLLSKGKHVTIELMDKDFNDILQQEGEDAVRKRFERGL